MMTKNTAEPQMSLWIQERIADWHVHNKDIVAMMTQDPITFTNQSQHILALQTGRKPTNKGQIQGSLKATTLAH